MLNYMDYFDLMDFIVSMVYMNDKYLVYNIYQSRSPQVFETCFINDF